MSSDTDSDGHFASHSHFEPLNTTRTYQEPTDHASRLVRKLTGTGNLNEEKLFRIPTHATDDPNLPHRLLSPNADLTEYTEETRTGEILRTTTTVDGRTQTHKLVTFTVGDKENPKNWSKLFRWYCTMVIAFTCFTVAMCSSVITPGVNLVTKEFDVSRTVGLLSVTFFVVGFGVGPMFFAPLSEILGRRIIYATTLGLAVIFVIPCAVAQNIETLLVCRFIDGIAFSAPMTLVGGSLADMWSTEERGVPMAAFSAAPFLGPALGPLVGGYLSDGAGWRWLYWFQLILSGCVYLLLVLTVPETYAPTILKKRAQKLRKETGDNAFVTEQDLDTRPLSEQLKIFLFRPFQLLFIEPIVLFMSLYMSVLYGLLYMFFVAYPIVFVEGKGWSYGSTGLMFIPLAIGVICSACCAGLVNGHYLKMCKIHNGRPPAEVRLIPMMISCWMIPIGLFIFAWTSYPRLVWVGPCLAGFPVGFGFIFLYNAANNYLVDSYMHQAASALAAKTFIRSFWGAATVLFTTQMYHRLGYQWASTLLAFLALACCAIPYVFWFYGARIRKMSRYAYTPPEEDLMQSEKERR
ncbi:major facilitator superfamily protein [Ascobolus immersus RN42]|uniref:Major facilitator superfamily protein n=1 Tax=Ascobolus immersus RN42 TaxID=1160509 RepID=A0A3N4IJE6_ASCIM|nr:major facilitator superfamily protein [Ascobolus immersus RN42]